MSYNDARNTDTFFKILILGILENNSFFIITVMGIHCLAVQTYLLYLILDVFLHARINSNQKNN